MNASKNLRYLMAKPHVIVGVLIILALTIAGIVIMAPHNLLSFNLNSNQNTVKWVPKNPLKSGASGRALPPWYRSSGAESAQAGMTPYISYSQERLGYAADTLSNDVILAEANHTTDEVWNTIKQHNKIAEFIQSISNLEKTFFFDGTYWHVSMWDNDDWEEWAYILVRDSDLTIIQIYIVSGDDVYLEWPLADLTGDQVMTIIWNDENVRQFLTAANLTIDDLWLWFDGEDTWYVTYYTFFGFGAQSVGTGEDSNEGTFGSGNKGQQSPLTPQMPSTEESAVVGELPQSYYWLNILVSDNEAHIIEIDTNYDAFAGLKFNMTTAKETIVNSAEVQTFVQQHDNRSFYSIDLYLQLNYSYSATKAAPQITPLWIATIYVWPNYVYEGGILFAETMNQGSFHISMNGGTLQIQHGHNSFTPYKFNNKFNILTATTTSAFNDTRFRDVFYWTFDYLKLALKDQTSDIIILEDLPPPTHNVSEILNTLIENTSVDDFLNEYDEFTAFITFDPFKQDWWINIYPTWTYLASTFAEIDDLTLTILRLDIHYIPEELKPQMSFGAVKSLVENLSEFQTFNDTYSKYGALQNYIYYYAYDIISYTNDDNDESFENISVREWNIGVYSDIIYEAWLYIRINDTSGTITEEYLNEPEKLPIHLPEEIVTYLETNVTDVTEYLTVHPNSFLNIYYYSGSWYVYYYDYGSFLDDFEYSYLYLIVDDATLQVTYIDKYP